MVDDKGTTAAEALQIIKALRDRGFESDNGKLALALGRPLEEVENWFTKDEAIDDDVILKARGIAEERGINLGSNS